MSYEQLFRYFYWFKLQCGLISFLLLVTKEINKLRTDLMLGIKKKIFF